MGCILLCLFYTSFVKLSWCIEVVFRGRLVGVCVVPIMQSHFITIGTGGRSWLKFLSPIHTMKVFCFICPCFLPFSPLVSQSGSLAGFAKFCVLQTSITVLLLLLLVSCSLSSIFIPANHAHQLYWFAVSFKVIVCLPLHIKLIFFSTVSNPTIS